MAATASCLSTPASTSASSARSKVDRRWSTDPAGVDIPDGFAPAESVLHRRSTFERALDALVEAGVDKQEAVAAINRLQADLDLAVEAAALLYARRQGVEVADLADRAREEV